jgi:hypothetical protein
MEHPVCGCSIELTTLLQIAFKYADQYRLCHLLPPSASSLSTTQNPDYQRRAEPKKATEYRVYPQHINK